KIAVGALIEEYVEVVEPKVGQDLFKLAVAIDRAQHLALYEIAGDEVLRTGGHLQPAAHIGRRREKQALTPASAQRREHFFLLVLRQRKKSLHPLLRRALAKRSPFFRGQDVAERLHIRQIRIGSRVEVAARRLLLLVFLHHLRQKQSPIGIGGKRKPAG